jgi:hypothetical protein
LATKTQKRGFNTGKVWQKKPKNAFDQQGIKKPTPPIIYTWFDVIHKFVEENTSLTIHAREP